MLGTVGGIYRRLGLHSGRVVPGLRAISCPIVALHVLVWVLQAEVPKRAAEDIAAVRCLPLCLACHVSTQHFLEVGTAPGGFTNFF